MTTHTPQPHFPASDHDHDACLNSVLIQAERTCANQGKRLTYLRRRVLELIWAGHKPELYT